MLRLFAVLLAAAFGHEVPLTPVIEITTPPAQTDTRVATNGDGFLAAWTDSRGGTHGSIYVSRFTRNGEPLDIGGIRLHEGSESSRLHDVIWTGTTYLIFSQRSEQILATPFGPSGAGEPLTVFPRHFNSETFEVATNGTNVLAMKGNGEGALLTAAGELQSTISLGRSWGDPAVASNGDGYLVIRNDESGMRSDMLAADGSIRSTSRINGIATAIAAASDGDGYLVVNAASNLTAWRISRDNEVSPPVALTTFDPTPAIGPFSPPHVAWTGTEYLAAARRGIHTDSGEVAIARLSRGGTLLTPARIPISARDLDVVSNRSGQTALLWSHGEGGVTAGLLDPATLNVLSSAPLIRTATPQFAPALASSGDLRVIAWMENVEGGATAIRLARLGGTRVTVAGDVLSWRGLSVAIDGDTVWVVWTNYAGRIAVRRFNGSLQPVDAAPLVFDFPAGHAPYQPVRIAAGAGKLLLVAGPSVLAARIAPVRDTLEVSFLTVDPRPYQQSDGADVAWTGSDFVIAWSTILGPYGVPGWPSPDSEIRYVRILPDGDSPSALPAVIAATRSENRVLSNARVARGRRGVLVAWQDVYSPRTYARYLTGDDQTTKEIERGTEVSDTLGVVVPDGDGFHFFWSQPVFYTDTSIRHQHVDANLRRIGEETFTPPAPLVQSQKQRWSAIAEGGVPLVAYSRRADEPEYGDVPRIFLRAGDSPRRRTGR